MRYKKILVATDFSRQSLAALESAANLYAEEVVLFTVVPDWTTSKLYARQNIHNNLYKEAGEQMYRESTEQLADLSADYFPERTVQLEALVSVHSAAHEIAKFATQNDCDLIVVASHGCGTVRRAMLGSTVQKLIQLSPCEVLVVPTATNHPRKKVPSDTRATAQA